MDISLPEGFVKRIKEDLGEEAEAFLRSFYDEPKRGLRTNPLKVSADKEAEITRGLKRVPWEEHGYYYEGGSSAGVGYGSVPTDSRTPRPGTCMGATPPQSTTRSAGVAPYGSVPTDSRTPRPGRSPLHAAGAYYIQEPSAMAPVNYLDVRPGMCVLDLCAAPGGKSTQIASKLKGSGLIVSNEIIPDRARILSQNIERMGIRNALVISHDPKELSLRFPASFDRILADAPCSGEGMFRRDDTAVREWSEDNVMMCAERQEMILERAAVMLKPGGRLVYSTCTFSKTEDEERVESFLEKHPDFHLLEAHLFDGMRENGGMIRIWPQDGYGEGHFMAVFERDGELLPEAYGYRGSKESVLNNKQKHEIGPWKDFVADVFADGSLKEFLTDTNQLFMFGSRLCAMPGGNLPLLAGLKTIRAGLELGEIRKGRFVPSHSLALALKPEEVLRTVELDQGNADEDYRAGQYLNGQTLKDPALRDNGWTVVTVSGISLGWVKATNGILKNHYPKGLRSYQ